MDIIRELLLAISDDEIDTINFDDHSTLRHLELLKEKGYIDGIKFMSTFDTKVMAVPYDLRLTWDGQDFIETIRPKNVWDKIKKFVSDKGVGLTIDAIKIAAPNVISTMLGSK
jgi:hypothetical protein